VLTNEGGTNVHLARTCPSTGTNRTPSKAAAEYAREWWREAGFEFDAPEDDQECIDVYFDHREDEFLETRLEVVR
jgi:hypothetical protein